MVGVDHVALRFRHLGAALDHHALRQQAGERFIEPDQAQVADDLGEEPRVEQVQDGMLDPADVLVDR